MSGEVILQAENLVKHYPIKAAAYKDEVIVFLGFGAAMVTGQTIVIDGGLTL